MKPSSSGRQARVCSSVAGRSSRAVMGPATFFQLADEDTDAAQGCAHRPLLAVEAEQQHRLAAHEGLADERRGLLAREGAEGPEVALGLLDDLGDQPVPAAKEVAAPLAD